MRSGGGEQNLFEQNKLVTTPIGSRNYAHTEGKTSRIPQCPSRSSKGRAARVPVKRTDPDPRQRLLENGFVLEVMKGWLISFGPGARDGDGTPWYASFWEFCARYCDERFGKEWYLSPEQSLLLHAENTVIPSQVVVYSPKGTNHTIHLLFRTSLYDLKQAEMPNEA